MDRSRPISLAQKAGTIVNSADRKSLSMMPYFSLRSLIILSFTRSLCLSSLKGRHPTKTLSSSPLTPSCKVRFICSFARWGSRSVMVKAGSSGSSPKATFKVSPFFLIMTPWRANGIAVHWYFLMPP